MTIYEFLIRFFYIHSKNEQTFSTLYPSPNFLDHNLLLDLRAPGLASLIHIHIHNFHYIHEERPSYKLTYTLDYDLGSPLLLRLIFVSCFRWKLKRHRVLYRLLCDQGS